MTAAARCLPDNVLPAFASLLLGCCVALCTGCDVEMPLAGGYTLNEIDGVYFVETPTGRTVVPPVGYASYSVTHLERQPRKSGFLCGSIFNPATKKSAFFILDIHNEKATGFDTLDELVAFLRQHDDAEDSLSFIPVSGM